jgi:tryptophan synthase alpha chain
VPLVAPTTPDERFAAIGASARGFLYAVSLTGTTGERGALDGALKGVIERAARSTSAPVAVGFGIATPEQAAAAAAAGADGVIVGSRLVREAGDAADAAAATSEIVRALGEALR